MTLSVVYSTVSAVRKKADLPPEQPHHNGAQLSTVDKYHGPLLFGHPHFYSNSLQQPLQELASLFVLVHVLL